MKVVVCTGTPWTGLEQVGALFKAAGIQSPINPVRGQATIESFHAQLEKLGQADSRSSFTGQPVHPGKIWGQQALGILQDNLNQQVWGWTNSFSTWLLEFWKSLDRNIFFVLLYSRPEEDVAGFMQSEVDPSGGRAADLWLAYNTQLLRFYNRNRDRCLLVSRNTVLSEPLSLLSLCNERFALSLQTDSSPSQTDALELDAIGFVLARSLLSDRDDVYRLFDEIQATATQPDNEDSGDVVGAAWSAYRQVLKAMTTQQEQASRELADQRRQLEEQSAELERYRSENELLLSQLHQVQEELEATFLDGREKQAEAKSRLAELTHQLEKNRNRVEELKKRVALQQEVGEKREELEQENELLLLQLHQVQEELEHYFLLYQESQAKQEEQGVQVQSDSRVKLFMSELSTGVNWYPVEEVEEEKLRWSGPGTRATIMLPIKRDTEKLLVIHYEQVVARDQLKGLRIEVDAEPVAHTVYDLVSRNYIVVQLSAMLESHGLETELAIVLPHMVKPSDVSESPDDRPLGIAVYSISVLPVTPRLRINWPDTSYRRLQLKRKISRIGVGIESFPLAYFDGRTYLQEYPDVAEAVRQGTVASALVHYVQHGAYDGHDFMLADTELPSEGDAHDLARIEQL